MIKSLWALLALGVTCALPAQDDPKAATESQAKKEYQALVAKFRANQQAHYKAYRALSDEEKKGFDFNLPAQALLPEFEAKAKAYEGSDATIPFLAWIAQSASRFDVEKAKAAAEILIADHVKSDQFGAAIRSIAGLSRSIGKDNAHAMLSTVVAKNDNDAIKAQALYSRANIFLGYTTSGSKEQQKLALADFRLVAELSTDTRLVERAKGKIYETENLSIGCEAPEITGEDLSGVEFKLSDYRGKIVFLDFWGNW